MPPTDDRDAVLDIAERDFDVSRFHLDPAIPDDDAADASSATGRRRTSTASGATACSSRAATARPSASSACSRRSPASRVIDIVAVRGRRARRGRRQRAGRGAAASRRRPRRRRHPDRQHGGAALLRAAGLRRRATPATFCTCTHEDRRASNIDERVVLVAEIGNNHEGDRRRAREMVRARRGRRRRRGQAPDVPGRALRAALRRAPLRAARALRAAPTTWSPSSPTWRATPASAFISTPFDLPSVDLLEPLVDAFKIASGDLDFIPLLRRVAATDKPVDPVDRRERPRDGSSAASTRCAMSAAACEDVAVLHCTSAYPAPAEDARLRAIPCLAERCACPIGFSDHTLGLDAAPLAVALGARIVEKHFTLEGIESDFRDHELSLTPPRWPSSCAASRPPRQMLGTPGKDVLEVERPLVDAVRRSIAVGADLPAGHVVAEDDLVWLRPGGGIAPGDEATVVGRALRARPGRRRPDHRRGPGVIDACPMCGGGDSAGRRDLRRAARGRDDVRPRRPTARAYRRCEACGHVVADTEMDLRRALRGRLRATPPTAATACARPSSGSWRCRPSAPTTPAGSTGSSGALGAARRAQRARRRQRPGRVPRPHEGRTAGASPRSTPIPAPPPGRASTSASPRSRATSSPSTTSRRTTS